MDQELLPRGRQFAITWGIPSNFGGMTSALLHRSAAFAREAGADVTVLTFEPRADTAEIAASLSSASGPAAGVNVLNIYDYWRQYHDDRPVSYGNSVTGPQPQGKFEMEQALDGANMTTWMSSDGTLHRRHSRSDGSIAIHETRCRQNHRTARTFTLHDHSSQPIRQWKGAWQFYASWLDELIGSEPSFAVVDSKTAARFMLDYSNPHITRLYLVHNSHLEGGSRPLGILRPSRKRELTRADDFDAVVFLTDQQRQDVIQLLGDSGNLEVIPNGRSQPGHEVAISRDPLVGVVLASLTPRKRLEHTLLILASVRRAGIAATLRIYGSGPEQSALEAFALDNGLQGAVEFAGYAPDAAEAFSAASWTLLTSEHEGAPLVLTEAMSRGCVPICYDIPYGPSDMIAHNATGFLVQDGDIAGASACLRLFIKLTDAERERIRRAAMKATAEQSDLTVVSLWGEAQRRAAERKSRPKPTITATIERAGVRYRHRRHRVTGTLGGLLAGTAITVELRNPVTDARVRATATRHGRRVIARFGEDSAAFLGGRTRLVITFILRKDGSRQDLTTQRIAPDTRGLAARVWRRINQARNSRLRANRLLGPDER